MDQIFLQIFKFLIYFLLPQPGKTTKDMKYQTDDNKTILRIKSHRK